MSILFRCSQLGNLMTNGRGKSVEMGETAKGYVRDLWRQTEYGYREEVMTDEMLKGHLCEQDSLALVQKVLGGEFRPKNTLRLQNDYITGTPDVILKREDFVEDVKTSYNLRTFSESAMTPAYFWQAMGYLWLSGKTKYRLIYCLVPTPDELITEQKKRFYFRFNCDESNPDYVRISDQIDHNNNLISTISAEKRIRVFEFDFEPEKIEMLKDRVGLARQYYKTLTL